MRKDEFIDFVFLDSCAFDPDNEKEAAAIDQLFLLHERNIICLEIPFAVNEEIEHPNTPYQKKARALGLIRSIGLRPDQAELELFLKILAALTGNGKRENYRRDALHLYESSKYMQDFITHDKRILRRRARLEALCKIRILRPSEYLEQISKKIQSL